MYVNFEVIQSFCQTGISKQIPNKILPVASLGKVIELEIYVSVRKIIQIIKAFFLFFSVLSSSFCRFTRAPHHENSLNLRWDWLELEQFFAGGNLCIFNLLAMNEKDPSRCFQQIGHMFLGFEFTNQPNVLNCDILYQDMTK